MHSEASLSICTTPEQCLDSLFNCPFSALTRYIFTLAVADCLIHLTSQFQLKCFSQIHSKSEIESLEYLGMALMVKSNAFSMFSTHLPEGGVNFCTIWCWECLDSKLTINLFEGCQLSMKTVKSLQAIYVHQFQVLEILVLQD